MQYTQSEVIQFVNENDVKFIRLAFCDIFGRQKNVSIMPSELERAFRDGIVFDASAVAGYENAVSSDLLLFPDPSTLAVLPWRPSHGRVVRFFCHIFYPDGRPFERDSRAILQQAAEELRQAGYHCEFGAECEFYLFQMDEKGKSTGEPLDCAGYMDLSPEDKGENIRREICLTLEEMGMEPKSSHHEDGPGQNEIDFKHGDALVSADNVTTFRWVVRTIAARNGMYATFRPKPLADNYGNGFHINITPRKLGSRTQEPGLVERFMAGILAHIREITIFLNPCTESYQRLGTFKAPRYVTWSRQDRTQLIRLPEPVGGNLRIELRSPDCMTNPYLAFALLLYAGLDGLRRDLKLPASCAAMPESVAGTKPALETLPVSLAEAVRLAIDSPFVAACMPERLVEDYDKLNSSLCL